MNRIIPIKVMIPIKIKIVSNPTESEEKLGIVGLDSAGMAASIDQMKSTIIATIMTGIIISIKLPVRPSFLPDSSDIIIPKMLFGQVQE